MDDGFDIGNGPTAYTPTLNGSMIAGARDSSVRNSLLVVQLSSRTSTDAQAKVSIYNCYGARMVSRP